MTDARLRLVLAGDALLVGGTSRFPRTLSTAPRRGQPFVNGWGTSRFPTPLPARRAKADR